MSGASAMASARRRRTNPQEQNQRPGQTNREVSVSDNNIRDNETNQLTPLQILKLHDEKIKELEELINNDSLKNESTSLLTNENNMQQSLYEKIEEIVSKRLNNINDEIKSLLLNIEKLSNITINNEKTANKIDKFINELNDLKMLVIKNQSMGLESNNDIIKLKDEVNEIKNYMDDNTNNNVPNTNDLLKTMFNSFNEDETMFSKINIQDSDSDDEVTLKNIENLNMNDSDNLQELNNIPELNNLQELNNIRNDVESEIAEKKLDNLHNISDVINITENA